jgi:ATP adenylyltransferase
MKRMWAPWRMQFIGGENRGCIFCTLPKEADDRKALLLARGRDAFVVMNRFPYNNGHLMVAPYRHVVEPGELRSQEQLEVMSLITISMEALKKAVRPAAFNLGANVGRSSGAGFEHLHFHIVPRWDGDTNFMPILGEAKVIPQYLEETYDNLRDSFPRRGERGTLTKSASGKSVTPSRGAGPSRTRKRP